jgi:hypothetical protein
MSAERMGSLWKDAAGELQLLVAASMGADATIQDWIAFERKCKAWSVPFATLFAEWLKERELGSKFCFLEGTEEQFDGQIQFVGRHVQGEARHGVHALY